MKLQKILSVLQEQEKNLNSLLENGKEKQQALVSNNGDKLNETVCKEEKNLLAIQLKEEDRLNLMTDLFQEYNIDNKRFKLEILISGLEGKVNPKILNLIAKAEKRMKTVIKSITKINHQNMLLIQQSRSLLNETIQAVVNSSNKSIVDRKG